MVFVCRSLLLNDNQLSGSVPTALTVRFPANSTSWSHNCMNGTSNNNADCAFVEWSGLVDLYVSTNGSSWAVSTNWLQATTSPCYWFGITCDSSYSTLVYVFTPAR